MIRFEDIAEEVTKHHKDADVGLLRRAYVFSAKEHKGQVRRSGEPYLIHPLAVAMILAQLKLDPVAVAVGLLHDVVEDAGVSMKKIEQYFGSEVASLVDGVTKMSRLSFTSREEQQAESFRKMLLAMARDIRVLLVKIADRLHNMRTLHHLPAKDRIRVARETMDIYVPLTNRLGMHRVQTELEDLAFRYLHPRIYHTLADKVEEEKRVSASFIKKVTDTIKKKLDEAGISASIEGRVKSVYSLYRKMMRQGVSLDQIYDYIAFRVITDTVANCWGALGIVHSLWTPVPGRFRDYISTPKPNGYQSLHTSVVTREGQVFEIQIRTWEMHRVAEEGIAAHWAYKEGRKATIEDRNFVWLRHIIEWQREVTNPKEFMTSLKFDLFPEEVYALTPKGEVKTFPRRATALDFAYAVHTEIGHQAVGARINGRVLPLKTQLKHGDIVEIITFPDHTPTMEALRHVFTSRAKNHIRRYLKQKSHHLLEELGKEVLSSRLNGGADEWAGRLLSEWGLRKREELFLLVTLGKVPLPKASSKSSQKSSLKKDEGVLDGRFAFFSPGVVKGKGFYLRAPCCLPLPGEEAMGVEIDDGLVLVHSSYCVWFERAVSEEARVGKIKWGKVNEERHRVRIRCYFLNRGEIEKRLERKLALIKGKVVERVDFEGRVRFDLEFEINNYKEFSKIAEQLSRLGGFLGFERMAL